MQSASSLLSNTANYRWTTINNDDFIESHCSDSKSSGLKWLIYAWCGRIRLITTLNFGWCWSTIKLVHDSMAKRPNVTGIYLLLAGGFTSLSAIAIKQSRSSLDDLAFPGHCSNTRYSPSFSLGILKLRVWVVILFFEIRIGNQLVIVINF